MNRKMNNHIAGFDGLKGFSIFAVVAYHLLPSQVPGGFLLVNSFLVLAGFFFGRKMEGLNLKSKSHNSSQAGYERIQLIGRYLMKTISRLFWPLFWMMTVVTLFFGGVDAQVLKSIRGDLISGLTFTNNLFQIHSDRSYFVQMTNASPFTHLWYNGIYLQSILVAVSLFLLVQRLQLRREVKALFWLVCAWLSSSLIPYFFPLGADPSRAYYGLETRFASFALGLSLVYLIPVVLNLLDRVRYKQIIYLVVAAISLLMMIYLAIHVSDQAAMTYYAWLPFYNYVSAGVIFAILLNTPLTRMFFNFKPLCALGQRSYSIYLWYYPVLSYAMRHVQAFSQRMWLFQLMVVMMLAVLSEISYRLTERPSVWTMDLGTAWQTLRHAPWNSVRRWIVSLQFILSLVFASLLVYSDNQVPLAQFQLEYQLYRTSPNIGQLPYPGETLIRESGDYLGRIDQLLATSIVTPIQEEAWLDKARRGLASDEKLLAQLNQEEKALYQSLVDQMPIVVQELSLTEMVFASQVPVTFFGDSLILLSGPMVLPLFQNGNTWGVKSLQIWDAIPLFEELLAEGFVKDNVVINLGTNAGLDMESMEELVALAGDRQIFFVNTASKVQHIQEVNEIIHAISQKYDNVHEVDWYSYQQGHPDWYYDDEIHHSPEGTQYFAVIVAKCLFEELPHDLLYQTEAN